jgi:ribosome-binding factor A
MQAKRSQKVAGQLKHEIGNILQTRIKDPLIGFVTITNVKLSDDLRYAKVYFSVLGNSEQKQNSLKGLNRARTYIQSEIGSHLRLRYLPVLSFYLDETLEYKEYIDGILKSIKSVGRSSENE